MTIEIHQNLINFVKPNDHAKYSPSSAERWLGGCAYSIKASEDIEEEERSYSSEGTLAHSVCEAVYRQQMIGLSIPVSLQMEMLTVSDRGEEMMQAAHGFYEVCTYWMENKDLVGDVVWFGQERGIPVFPEKGCYGTGDFIIVGTKASVVIDFKYGRKPVKAESKQLMVYAAGIARHINNINPDEYKVYAVIYQPRVSTDVKETSYSCRQLYKTLQDIHDSIDLAERDDNEPIEGSHCFWCPARRTKNIEQRCKAILEKPIKIAQENFKQFVQDANLSPTTIDNKVKRDEALIKLMSLKPMIDMIVEQGEDDFMRRFEAGEAIPGLQVIEKKGNRTYNAENDEEAIKMLMKAFPDKKISKEIKKTKPRTITELEKELGKGSLDQFTKRKITKKIKVLDQTERDILSSMGDYINSNRIS